MHQGATMVADTWMNDHTRRLINNNNVVILVDDVERNILWHDLLLTAGIGHNDRYLVERLYLIARLLRLAIDKDILAIGSRLYAVTRGVLQTRGEKLIESHQRLSLIHRHREVLIHLITLIDAINHSIEELLVLI